MKTMNDAGAKWIEEMQNKRSIRQDIYRLNRILPYIGHMKLNKINTEILNKIYKKMEIDKRLVQCSMYSTLVRSILNRAYKVWNWLDTAPSIFANYKKDTNRIRYLTKQELSILLEELHSDMRDVVEAAVYTGLRKSNLLNLKWQDVNIEEKYITIDATNIKNNQHLRIPINNSMLNVLKRRVKCCDYVFTYHGNKITEINTKSWRNALKRAKIENFRFHDLRHTFASWHIQNGTPLYALQMLGGWSSSKMVQRYAHLNIESLRSYVENV